MASADERERRGGIWPWTADLTVDEKVRLRRSRVRTMVTHGAAWCLFAGGALLIAYLMVWGGEEGVERGIDLFLTILPVAASIVSFWFAHRMQKGEGDRTRQ